MSTTLPDTAAATSMMKGTWRSRQAFQSCARTKVFGVVPCCLPLMQGMISIKTLSKLAQLRHEGVMLVSHLSPVTSPYSCR